MSSNTRDRILDAAEHLFAQKGLEGASLRAITDEADANLGSIHYYFGSKMKLIEEVINRRVDQLNQMRFEVFQEPLQESKRPPLKELWHTALRAMLILREQNPDFIRMVGFLMWSPDSSFREMLYTRENLFSDTFLSEILEYFPEEVHQQVSARCIMLLHMIYQHAIDQHYVMQDFAKYEISMDVYDIVEQLADIAENALQKFLPGTS
jgi:AcrR family transcriptional regulator